MSRLYGGWVLPTSIICSMLLQLFPLPPTLLPWRPYWLALVLIYWAIELPEKVGLGVAFCTGIIADVLYGGHIGEQSLRLVVMLFLVERFRIRLRFFPLPQQAVVVCAYLYNDRLIALILHFLLNEQIVPWSYWYAPLIGALLWMPLFIFLDALHLGQRQRK